MRITPKKRPNDISKSANYLFYGKEADRKKSGRSYAEAKEHRVDWALGFGDPTVEGAMRGRTPAREIAGGFLDHEQRALDMRYADGKKRGRSREYDYVHFVVAFDKKDAAAGKLSPERQQEVVKAFVKRIGLEGHVGMAVAHKDTDDPHVHLVFHRSHAQTGKTWEPTVQAIDHPKHGKADQEALDYPALQNLAFKSSGQVGIKKRLHYHQQQLSQQYGLNVIADIGKGRHNEAEHLEAKRQGKAAFLNMTADERKDAREKTAADFKRSQTWHGLAARLEEKGYRLGMAGTGSKAALFLYTDTEKAKLSDIFGKDKDIRKAAIEQRLGQSFLDYVKEAKIELPERLDIGQAPPARKGGIIEGAGIISHMPRDKAAARDAWAIEAEAASRNRADIAGDKQALDMSNNGISAAERALADAISAVTRHQQRADAERREMLASFRDAFTNSTEVAEAWAAYERASGRASNMARVAFAPESVGRLKGSLALGAQSAARKKAVAALEKSKVALKRFIEEKEKHEKALVQVPQADANLERQRVEQMRMFGRKTIGARYEAAYEGVWAGSAKHSNKWRGSDPKTRTDADKKAMARGDVLAHTGYSAFESSDPKTRTDEDKKAMARGDVLAHTGYSAFESSVLVAHGAAPYQNRKDGEESYFVTLRNDVGEERTFWGKGLASALQNADAKDGDRISLNVEAQKEVKVRERLPNGSTREIDALRNIWAAKVDKPSDRFYATFVKTDGSKYHLFGEQAEKEIQRVEAQIGSRVDVKKNQHGSVELELTDPFYKMRADAEIREKAAQLDTVRRQAEARVHGLTPEQERKRDIGRSLKLDIGRDDDD